MKNKGFTLLELLVVVLIIGILAAIALPQYKKAVLKSRFATVKSNVQALASSMQRYYMINNEYPDYSLNNLDIEIKEKNDEHYYTNGKTGSIAGYIRNQNGKPMLSYVIYLMQSNVEDIKINTYYCVVYDGKDYENDVALINKLCQQETGKTEHSYKTTSYTWYAY